MKDTILTNLMSIGVAIVLGAAACFPYPKIYERVLDNMFFEVQVSYEGIKPLFKRENAVAFLTRYGIATGRDTAQNSSALSNIFRRKATFTAGGVSLTIIGLMLLLAWASYRLKLIVFKRILRASIIYVASMTALMLAGMWFDLKMVIRSAPDQDIGGYLRIGFIFYSIFISAFTKPFTERAETSEFSTRKIEPQFAAILASTVAAGFYANFVFLVISGFTLLPLTRKKDTTRPARNLLRINTGLSLGFGTLIFFLLASLSIQVYVQNKVVAIIDNSFLNILNLTYYWWRTFLS